MSSKNNEVIPETPSNKQSFGTDESPIHTHVIKDVFKKEWKIGPKLSNGDYGNIYLTNVLNSNEKYNYVMKLELSRNGPLFVEQNFYIKYLKEINNKQFCNKYNLKTLGIPVLEGFGTCNIHDINYRFIILPKLGMSLSNILHEYKTIPLSSIYKISIQMLYNIEFIHSHGFIHGDIKNENIVLNKNINNNNNKCNPIHTDNTSDSNNRVFCIDFGLVRNLERNKKQNNKIAFDGTLKYIPTDTLKGLTTYKCDLESLSYLMVTWLGLDLPWSNCKKNKYTLINERTRFMKSYKQYLQPVLNNNASNPIILFFDYINSIHDNDLPDYNICREIFRKELKKINENNIYELCFKK